MFIKSKSILFRKSQTDQISMLLKIARFQVLKGQRDIETYYLEKAKLTRSVRTSRPVRRLTKVVAIVIPALGPSFIEIEVLYNDDFSLNRCTPNRSHLTSFMNNPKSENLCVVKLFNYMLIRKML